MNEDRCSKNSGRYRCRSRRAREASVRVALGTIALATAGPRDPAPPTPLTASREIRVVRRALPKYLRRAAASWRRASPLPGRDFAEIIGDRLDEFVVDVNRILQRFARVDLVQTQVRSVQRVYQRMVRHIPHYQDRAPEQGSASARKSNS